MNRRQFLKLTVAVPVTAIVARLPEKPLEGETGLLRGCRFLRSRVDRTQAEFERDFLGAFEGVDWGRPTGDETWVILVHPRNYEALRARSAPDWLTVPFPEGTIAVAPSLAGG